MEDRACRHGYLVCVKCAPEPEAWPTESQDYGGLRWERFVIHNRRRDVFLIAHTSTAQLEVRTNGRWLVSRRNHKGRAPALGDCRSFLEGAQLAIDAQVRLGIGAWKPANFSTLRGA